MKIGTTDVAALSMGSTDINKVMLGTSLVWERSSDTADIVVVFETGATQMNFDNSSWSYDDGTNSGSYTGAQKVTIAPNVDVEITISKGSSDSFTFYKSGDLTVNAKITKITVNDIGSITTLSSSFRSVTGMTSFIYNADFSGVTTFYYAFFDCDEMVTFPLMDTSGATIFFAMFAYCAELTNLPALDFSNGTDLRQIFAYCSALVCFDELDFSSGINLASTFYGCTSLTQPAATGTSVRATNNALAGTWSNSGACP